MTRTRIVIVSLCLLCIATQGGCKGLKALAGIVKTVSGSGIDDVMRVGRGVKGAVNAGDDVVSKLGMKAARGAGSWGLKQLKEAMSAAETNTTRAHEVLVREGPHAMSRGMAFLRLRYEQNVAALNEEFSTLSDEMSESKGNAARSRISRIAREQAAIASLAERMK